jgi:hypothetical protein
MPGQKRTILVAMLALILLVVPVTVHASGDVVYFERPGIEPGGAVVETIAEKAGRVKALAKLTPRDLDRLENANLASASRELLALLGLASSGAGAETRGILANALPGASAVFKEGFNDVVSFVTGQTEEDSSDLDFSGASEFIEDALRTMISVDTSYFIDEEVRREFWTKTGIYQKYTNSQIAYINQSVIPVVAAYLVSNNEMGLFTLWQALNGVGAEVSMGTVVGPQQVIMGIVRSEPFYGAGEQGNWQKIMELFNGSVGALGLLYHASYQHGSGAGEYAGLEGYLANFEVVTVIPLAKGEERYSSYYTGAREKEGTEPPSGGTAWAQGSHNSGVNSSAFEFSISHRITK